MWLLAMSLLVGAMSTNVRALHCGNPPPGVSILKRGVDVTTIDLHPLDSYSDTGIKKSVIDFTCDEGKTWTDSNGNQYDLPDQILDIVNTPTGLSSTRVDIIKTQHQLTTSMAVQTGLWGSYKWYAMFSAGASYMKKLTSITRRASYIEDVSKYHSVYKADMVPNDGGTYFQTRVASLPEHFTSDADKDAYYEFIKDFGTDYFTTGDFGGLLLMTIETKASFYHERSDEFAAGQAELMFFGKLSLNADGSGSSSKHQLNEKFNSSSKKSLRYFGGVGSPEADVNSWQQSIIKNPWMFSAKISPLAELIKDTNRKSAFQLAVTAYLNKAALKGLKRSVLASFSPENNRTHIESIMNQIDDQLTRKEPVDSDVSNLLETFETDYVIPPWFSDDVQLCYDWYDDFNRKARAKTHCAHPNEMTSWYKDISHRGFGLGFQMRWGLIPTRETQPLWFYDVEICLKWEAKNLISGLYLGQCQNSAGTFCAPFGTYTSLYKDHTGYGNGCQMSWKLVVPIDSPRWLKNAKICLAWEPSGVYYPKQWCSGADRKLCAKANEWTPVYLDNTSFYGCEMSWGLVVN